MEQARGREGEDNKNINKRKEEDNSYHLLVGGALIRVGGGGGGGEREVMAKSSSFSSPSSPPSPPPSVNEDDLLAALREAHSTIGPKPKAEESTAIALESIPPNFLNDVKNGNQQVLIEHVRHHTLHAVFHLPNSSHFDLLDLCAYGGFPRCLNFLREIRLRPDYTHAADSCLHMAARGGHMNMIGLIEPHRVMEDDFLSLAQQSGNPLFVSAVKGIHSQTYKPEEFVWSSYLELLVIPSLVTISIAVVTSQLIRRTFSPSRLLALPSPLFGSLCEDIAKDAVNGYSTLVWLKKEVPELGSRIPAAAWLDSFHSGEQKTRLYTYPQSRNIFTSDYEQPLIDVFAELDSFVIEPQDEFEEQVTEFDPQPREVGAKSIVNQAQFLEQFRTFTERIFDDFDFSNLVIIGGSVIGSLLPLPPSASSADEYYKKFSPFRGSDVDITIYGLDRKGFNQKVRDIYEHMKKVTGREVWILRSECQIVFGAHFPFRAVQITLTPFRNVWQILTGVDIDCSALRSVAFDGKKLWASPRARMAVNRRWTVANQSLLQIRGTPTYESRLIKYARRGFTIIDREFHLYSDSYETKPPYASAETSCWQARGAELLSSAYRWPEIAQQFEILARRGIPYGPDKGDQQLQQFLEDEAYLADSGYGPEDTCLRELSESEFYEENIELLEECMGFGSWYNSQLKPLPPPQNNENENVEIK